MKSSKLFLGIIVITFVILLFGCKMEPDDPTYAVWTDSTSYVDFSNSVGTLADGYYRKFELSNSEFNAYSLSNEYKHIWTEGDIYNWFWDDNLLSRKPTN